MVDSDFEGAINTYGDSNIPPGMLSSPHIAYCVEKYKIIDSFKKSCLDSASYHMRLGNKVLTWENGKKKEFNLGAEEDRNKNIFTKVELKPNSLTFITTIEKFNLPKDIIARFNLKSKLVHKGLLLGTGPIVDPELKANLLIPIHNFSSQYVTLNYDEKIISVEFTKTLNPDQEIVLNGKKFDYVNNASRIFDFEKYVNRIGGGKIESSVSSKMEEFDKILNDYSKKLNWFSWAALISVASLTITLFAGIITTWILIRDAQKQLTEATSIVKAHPEKNYDFSTFALKSTVVDLQNQIKKLEEQNKENYVEWMLRPENRSEFKKKFQIQKNIK